jgi:hypothetical protein
VLDEEQEKSSLFVSQPLSLLTCHPPPSFLSTSTSMGKYGAVHRKDVFCCVCSKRGVLGRDCPEWAQRLLKKALPDPKLKKPDNMWCNACFNKWTPDVRNIRIVYFRISQFD